MSYQQIELQDISEEAKPIQQVESEGSNCSLQYLPVYVDDNSGQMYAAGPIQTPSAEMAIDEKKHGTGLDAAIDALDRGWNWFLPYAKQSRKWTAKWSIVAWNKTCTLVRNWQQKPENERLISKKED